MVGWRHERRKGGWAAGIDDEGSSLGHGDERVFQRFGERRRSCSVLSITMWEYSSSGASEQGRPRQERHEQQQQARKAVDERRCPRRATEAASARLRMGMALCRARRGRLMVKRHGSRLAFRQECCAKARQHVYNYLQAPRGSVQTMTGTLRAVRRASRRGRANSGLVLRQRRGGRSAPVPVPVPCSRRRSVRTGR
jgi:hypothetical protein